MSECPTRFTLSRWRVADLPSDEQRAVTTHVEQCEACNETVSAIAQVAAEQESRLEERLKDFDERLAEVRSQGRRRAVVLTAFGSLAAAACVAVVLGFGLLASDRTPISEEPVYTGLKGTLKFQVVAKRGDEQFAVHSNTELREDDALRFVVITGSAGYVTVFSIDSRGTISSFYPDANPAADPAPFRLDGAGRHELPGSIVLDNALGEERLVVAFSKTAFDRNDAHQQIVRVVGDLESATLEQPAGETKLSIGVLTINKR